MVIHIRFIMDILKLMDHGHIVHSSEENKSGISFSRRAGGNGLVISCGVFPSTALPCYKARSKSMDFQTPIKTCEYMMTLLPHGVEKVLEPTPGEGNLVRVLQEYGYQVDAPTDFFEHPIQEYDAIVMNPPFTPMLLGYKILYQCMEMSNIIIAIMPWLTLINSEKRTKDIIDFGLHSIVHLPRSTFKGARVQTCILKMVKGYDLRTEWSAL